MRNLSPLFPLLLLLTLLPACNIFDDDDDSGNGINVAGVWRGLINFQSCTPADVCSAAGFQAGSSANATLEIRQNGNDLDGDFTYDGSGVTADVDGNLTGSAVDLSGSASNLLGTVTIDLDGTVNEDSMTATISHDIRLSDGRNGTVQGAGTLTR